MSALCRYCCKSLFGVANENSQTGYLGGAMASHVRIGSPLLTHILFGLYLGLMLWGGLWLRDRSVRDLMPWRR